MNKKAAVIFTLNDKTHSTDTNLYSGQRIVRAKTVWLEFDKYLEYENTAVKDRVNFLLEHWIDDFSF